MDKINNNYTNTSAPISEVLFEYLRYWKWFLISLILALVIAVGIILVTSKQYKPSLSILLNEAKTSKSMSPEAIDLESFGFLTPTRNIENEIIVLSSPDLIKNVAKSLYLNITYYKRGFRETEIYKKSPFLVTTTYEPDPMNGICDFYIQKTDSTYRINGSYFIENKKNDFDLTVDKLPYELKINDIMALNINLSGENIIQKDKYYIKVRDIESTTQSLVSKLSVTGASPKSSVLGLSILVNNISKGNDILNELIYQYNKDNTKLNNEIAFNTALFINERLKEISIELSDAETEVVEYKQQHNIADLSSEAQLFVSQTGENERNLMEAETQLNIIRYIQTFLNNPQNKTKIIPNMGISDAGLSQIIQEYNGKLLASDQLLKGTGEKNPARLRVLEELDNMLIGISGSLNNVRETYTVTRNDLQRRSYATKSNIRSVPKQEKGLIEKVREQKIKENLFLFLMQKREETNLSIAATSDKARIITSTQKQLLPVAPKSKVILLAFIILGILTPIVIIYIKDLFKTKISSRDEFEKISNVPVLGEIVLNKDNGIILVNKQHDVMTEMFRSLRNNIKFISPKASGLTILTTSTISGEGKTFISINLALSFAHTNKKVLLIGADLRNPRVYQHLNIDLKNKRGLSDYLVSDDNNWKDLLTTPFKDLDNFHVFHSGTIPPNPNELLLSPRLKTLIETLQQEYEYIIIDSAPVGLVSDSYLIDQYADITLYVVRENKTPRTSVNFINTQLIEDKLTNMYVVINGTELTNNYKYGYGKGYGYSKGNNAK